MIPVRPLLRLRGIMHRLCTVGAAALVLVSVVSAGSAQNPAVPKTEEMLPPAPAINNQAALPTLKPRVATKKTPLEKTKCDAAELSSLADQLQDELNKMNVNILSLDVLQKTEAIEKLAKKIKGEADER
jgi:hypothetical protein